MEESGSNKNLIVAAVAVIVILAVAAGGFIFLQNKNTAPTQVETNNANSMPSGEPANTTSTGPGKYKDGTYTAEGTYQYHSGSESIKVTITLENDVIKDADVVSEAKAEMSKLMQGKFISGYKPMVVGKNIDEVTLTKVSGSSLTPIGFNQALDEIKTQAGS